MKFLSLPYVQIYYCATSLRNHSLFLISHFELWNLSPTASNSAGYFVWPKLWSPFKKKQVEVKWIHSSVESRQLCWKRFVTALKRITDLLFLKILKPETPSNSSNSNPLSVFYSYTTLDTGVAIGTRVPNILTKVSAWSS